MDGKKISFKAGIETLVRSHFPGLKMENPGTELIARLINKISSDLLSSTEKNFKSSKVVDEGVHRHLAQKAITQVFPGGLARNALSEAHKQMALLQSGCMTYGSDDRVAQQLKRRQESAMNESMRRQKSERVEKSFRIGVKKTFAHLLPNLSLDARAEQLLGHRIHNFAKIIAEDASKTYEKKDELQPVDVKNIISKYLEPKAMSAANSEGNKCLVLYENGLLDFKPRQTIKSGWSVENVVAQEQIFASVFKPGIKSLISDASPDTATDANAPKYLGHILMDVARHLAETTADRCKKKKITEIGNEELARAVAAVFPEQLRQHAILHASEDVAKYTAGLLIYEREPEKPRKPKPRTVRKSSKPPARKRGKSPKGRSTSRKSSNKRPGSKSSKAKSAKKQPRKPRVVGPPPKKSVFAPLLNETVPTLLTNVDVSLARDASNRAGGMLEDVCQLLVSVAVSRAGNEKELGEKQVSDAIFEVLPKQLAELAVAFGSSIQQVDILKIDSK